VKKNPNQTHQRQKFLLPSTIHINSVTFANVT